MSQNATIMYRSVIVHYTGYHLYIVDGMGIWQDKPNVTLDHSHTAIYTTLLNWQEL